MFVALFSMSARYAEYSCATEDDFGVFYVYFRPQALGDSVVR